MSGCQNKCICSKTATIRCFQRFDFAVYDFAVCEFGFKMHFTACCYYLFAHGSDDLRQLIGTNMWMRLIENFFFGSKLVKQLQHFINAASLAASRVSLTITVSSG